MIYKIIFILLCHILMTNSLKSIYQGCIYPYLIYLDIQSTQNTYLKFIRLDQPYILNAPTQSGDKLSIQLFQNYDLLPTTYEYNLSHLISIQIEIKSKMIMISDAQLNRYEFLTENYHLYLAYINSRLSSDIQTEEESGKNNLFSEYVQEKKNDLEMIANVIEFNNNYMLVAYSQNQTYSQIKYRNYYQIFINNQINDKFSSKIIGLKLFNYPLTETFEKEDQKFIQHIQNIYMILYSSNAYCRIRIQYSVKFQLYIQSIDCHQKTIVNMVDLKNQFVFMETLNQTNKNFFIVDIGKISINCEIPQLNYSIFQEIDRNLLACTNQSCKLFATNCTQIFEFPLTQYKSKLLQLVKIDYLNFPIGNNNNNYSLSYLSTILLTFKDQQDFIHYFDYIWCGNDTIVQHQLFYNGIKITKYCKKYVVYSKICSHLLENQCNIYSHCKYQPLFQRCEPLKNNIKQIFDKQIYQQKNQFLQNYALQLQGYGKSNPIPKCKTQQPFAVQKHIFIDKKCYYFDITDKFSYQIHRFNYDGYIFTTLCENKINEISPYNCQKQQLYINKGKYYEFFGFHYVILVFDNNNTFSNSTFFILNKFQIRSQQVAFKNFVIIIISILSFSVLLIVYSLFENIIKNILALCGIIEYVALSHTSPLNSLELTLELKYLIKQGFIKQYKYNKKASTTEIEIEQCCICLQRFRTQQRVIEIYCQHKIHKQCFKDWIKNYKNLKKCPMCRRTFTKQELELFISTNNSIVNSFDSKLQLSQQ